MSNDLISRSALSKKICNKKCDVPRFETEAELNAFLLGLNAKQIAVMECLSNMPTAYDVDKVVERLRKEISDCMCDECDRHTDCDTCRAEKAVEIVKSGGIE